MQESIIARPWLGGRAHGKLPPVLRDMVKQESNGNTKRTTHFSSLLARVSAGGQHCTRRTGRHNGTLHRLAFPPLLSPERNLQKRTSIF